MKESSDAVFGVSKGSGPVMDRYLDNTESLRRRQHRQEAMHALRQVQSLDHIAAEGLEAAVVIVEPEAGHQSDEPVEHPRRHCLVPGIEPGRLPAVDEVGPASAEQGEHPRDFGRVVLSIAVEHHDPVCSATRKPSRERSRFSLTVLETNAAGSWVGRCEALDLRPRSVGRTIVHEEQFPGEPGGVERRADLSDQRGDVTRLISHGDDERYDGRGHGSRKEVAVGRKTAAGYCYGPRSAMRSRAQNQADR